MKVSNCKVRALVQACEVFVANNIFSEKHGDKYIVFSYGHHFPIYANVRGKWYANADKYSVTTSRHQSQAHPHVDCERVPTSFLRALI